MIAARDTQPVPWTSSLKHGILGLYLSRIRRAVYLYRHPVIGTGSRAELTVIKTEVFKVDVCPRIKLTSGLDENVDELVIPLTPDALLAQSKIQVIFQQVLVVCATVKDYWESPIGVDAGA